MRRSLSRALLLAAGCTMSTSNSAQARPSVALIAPPAAPPRVPAGQPASILDSVSFGEAGSEAAHHLEAGRSEVVAGGLGQSARRLLAPQTPGWEGGRMGFMLKVDPLRENFFTVRLWGGEGNVGRLLLFCEGKQVGYRHLGEVDMLDFGSENGAPPTPGRFFYKTLPLPLAVTKGKTQLRFEIQAIGRIWAYVIAMNTTRDKSFPLQVLAEGQRAQQARELVSRKRMKLDAPLQVGPTSTLVFDLRR